MTDFEISLFRKIEAGQALAEALSSPPDTHASSQLPDLLKAHYAASLLDWLLTAVTRSTGNGQSSGKKAQQKKTEDGAHPEDSTKETSAGQLELWNLLLVSLNLPSVPPTRPLPASLLTSITAALQLKLHQKDQETLLRTITELLELIRGKFAASFKPTLEPTAALLEAALAHRNFGDAGVNAAVSAVQLLLPLVQLHPNPRKSWDAVVPRLTSLLVDSAVLESDGTTQGTAAVLKKASLEMISAAAFSQAHIPVLAEAAGIVVDGPKDTTLKSIRTYAAQFFKQVESLVNAESDPCKSAHVVYQTLPWVVDQFSIAFKEFKRAAAVAAAIASASSSARLSSKDAESTEQEGRTIGGVPIDADYKVFAAITAILKRKMEELAGKNGGWVLSQQNSSAVYYMLTSLGAVCSTLKRCHMYRATEDHEGHHRAWLGSLVDIAVGVGAAAAASAHHNLFIDTADGPSSNSITNASIQILQAILAVEHRGVQQHLPTLWPMLWSQTPADTAGIAGPSVQITVAVSLVEAYAELRQLEVLFSSLERALCAVEEQPSGSVAALLGSSAFRGALESALSSVPSGQVAALVRMVARWISEIESTAAPLLVGDLGVACLAALTVDVTTAPAVSDGVKDLFVALGSYLSPILFGKKGSVRASHVQGKKGECTATWLALYCQALKLHTQCCLLHPEVHPLPGHELQYYVSNTLKEESNTLSTGGYFDALRNSSSSSNDSCVWPSESYQVIWNLGGEAPGACPSLQAAVLTAAGQRIQTLYYRELHAQHACSTREADGGTAGGKKSRNAAEEELEMLSSLLIERALSATDLAKSEKYGVEPDAPMQNFSLATLGQHAVPAVGRGVIMQGVVLDAIQRALPEKRLANLVRLLLEEGDVGSTVVERLAAPELAGVLPGVVAKRVQETLR